MPSNKERTLIIILSNTFCGGKRKEGIQGTGEHPQNMEECPVCLTESVLNAPVCPNGHRVCAECQPRIQAIRSWRTGGAQCPMCRAPIPYIPINPALEEPGSVWDDVAQQEWARERVARQIQRRMRRDARVVEQAERRVRNLNRREDTEARRERANRGFEENRDARIEANAEFTQLRATGQIPWDAQFGGVHRRKCGVRNCERTGGAQGVRFLKFPNGTRQYRCEACFTAVAGHEPPPTPEFVRHLMA